MKNLCGKLRKVNNPYEVYRNTTAGWEWRVLKKWQSPDNETGNPYARWLCAVKSPMTFGTYDLGDVYVSEVLANGVKVEHPVVDKW